MPDALPTRRFLFWNVNRRDLAYLIVPLVRGHGVDVVVLNEPPDGTGTLDALRRDVSADFHEPTPPPAHTRPADAKPERFRCYARDAGLDLTERHRGSRTSVRRLTLGGDRLLLALVHGLDPRNHDAETRQDGARELADAFRFAADQQGTNRLVVLGDFNMNPFDRGMNLAGGLNAMMTRRCVERGTRRQFDRDHDLFYNPMWSLFGDDTPGPAGTIWDGSGQGPYGWSMFDQVLVHHSLVRRFRSVRILTEAGGTSLATANGRPDKTNASDHFPILLTLRERDPNE